MKKTIENRKRTNKSYLFGPGNNANPNGRPKGTPNKITKEVKEVISEVFENMGGVEAFTTWAKANPKIFYPFIYTKIIPKNIEIDNTDGKPFEVRVINGN